MVHIGFRLQTLTVKLLYLSILKMMLILIIILVCPVTFEPAKMKGLEPKCFFLSEALDSQSLSSFF